MALLKHLLLVTSCSLLSPFSCAQQTETTTTTTASDGIAAGGPPRRRPGQSANLVLLESLTNNNHHDNDKPLAQVVSFSVVGRYLTFIHDLWSVDDTGSNEDTAAATTTNTTTTTITPLDIIGTSRGYCQVLDGTSTTGTLQCTWTLTITHENDTGISSSNSNLMLYGDTTTNLQDWWNGNDVGKIGMFSITGGTGDYKGVSGTMQVTKVDESFRLYQAYFS